MPDILGSREHERSLRPTEEAMEGGNMPTLSEVCGKEDGYGLSESAVARGRGGATLTGVDTRILSMPGGLGEFHFAGTVFGSRLIAFPEPPSD